MEIPLIVVTSPREKSGKTTLVFNLAAALWQDGYHVGIASHYVEIFEQKRRDLCLTNGLKLPFPKMFSLSDLAAGIEQTEEKQVVVAEIPTDENEENKELMAKAHTLVTVVNQQKDADWSPTDAYLNLIWQAKKTAAVSGRKYLNWIVTENCLSTFADDDISVEEKSRRYGFRFSPILQHREAYRHISEGYCAADMLNFSGALKMSFADVYARREILKLTDFMWQQK